MTAAEQNHNVHVAYVPGEAPVLTFVCDNAYGSTCRLVFACYLDGTCSPETGHVEDCGQLQVDGGSCQVADQINAAPDQAGPGTVEIVEAVASGTLAGHLVVGVATRNDEGSWTFVPAPSTVTA